MASLTKTQLKADIKDILHGADLSQLSSKKVRKQLEEKYDVDLTERRKEIDQLLMARIEEKAAKGSESEDEGDKSKDAQASASSESDLDEPTDLTPAPSKKQRKSSSVKKEPPEQDDEELARKLQEEEEGMSVRRTRRSSARPSTQRARKSPAAKKAERKPRTSKPTNGYLRASLLSPALANIVGTDRLPNNEVVKKMWEIARERNLFDPRNKSFIICDEELFTVFKRRRVRLFGCMKFLGDHILSKVEEEQLL